MGPKRTFFFIDFVFKLKINKNLYSGSICATQTFVKNIDFLNTSSQILPMQE